MCLNESQFAKVSGDESSLIAPIGTPKIRATIENILLFIESPYEWFHFNSRYQRYFSFKLNDCPVPVLTLAHRPQPPQAHLPIGSNRI